MFLQQVCGITQGPPSEKTAAVVNQRGIVGRRKNARPNLLWWRNKWQNHLSSTQMRAYLGEPRWQSASKVTTVRNPFDRMLSGFYWRLRKADRQAPAALPELRAAVEDFILNSDFPDDRDIFFDNGSFVPDQCLRYEHLESDLAALCDAHNIETANTSLPRTKATGTARGDFALADFFTPRAVDAVLRNYDWSFERFGYAPSPDQTEPADNVMQPVAQTQLHQPIPTQGSKQ